MMARVPVVLVCILLFAWLASQVVAGSTESFDASVRAAVHSLATPAFTAFLRGITLLGSNAFVCTVAGLAAVGLIARGGRSTALLLVSAVAGAMLLDTVLKHQFHRFRPDPFFDTPLPGSYSFPSGHALLSLTFYSVAAAIMLSKEQRPWRRVTVWVCALCVVVLIGLSRVYLGVHWPTDVLGGYLAAIAWTLTITTTFHRLGNTKRS